MKRIVSLLFVIFCLSTAAIAQESLEGTWRISMNMMGINATSVMIFEGATSGVVTEKVDMAMDFKFLGNRMTGKMKASHKGNFVLEDNVLTIKWMPETSEYTMIEPVQATANGKPDADLLKDANEMFDELIGDIMNKNPEDDIYNPVKIRGNKLTLKSRNKEGKTETETYTRVTD